MAKVFTSSVVPAPIEAVWARVRDFNALPAWNPAVERSRIEGGLASDVVGCVRSFDLKDGGNLREQLLALDDRAHSCTYSILESPMPLQGYVARLRLLPITNGDRTYVEWTAEFDCAAEEEADLVQKIGQDVFQGSFDVLEREFGTAR
jgi:Polyketide cyclase / dehydrase and lipid transport